MRTLIFTLVITTCLPAMARKKKQPTLVDYVADRIEEATIAPPKDGEACFSPNGNCDVKLWKYMQSAQKSLDIAVFDLTHSKITHEILVASKKFPVRIVVDRRQAKGEHSLVSLLVKAGANVRIGHQRGIMHNKFTILDGAWIETGSFNYTDGASAKNNENQLYLNNPKIVEQYQKRFEEIWKDATPVPPEIAAKG